MMTNPAAMPTSTGTILGGQVPGRLAVALVRALIIVLGTLLVKLLRDGDGAASVLPQVGVLLAFALTLATWRLRRAITA